MKSWIYYSPCDYSFQSPAVKVFLDTFMDLDRGYFPRLKLYDRRLNPRKGGRAVRRLAGAINMRGGEDVELRHKHARR